MGWVRGIREVRQVTIALDGDQVGLRRGPVMTKQERVIIDLPAEAWARLVHFQESVPPLCAGAGPCGTLARCPFRTRMLWSVEHLIEPLAAYYAAYVPPMRFGAKPGPRGRRAA